ncbi:MFS transporter [Blastomonas sp. SL216]|uniref:MFS transporter n=1 Tax=Blastomonas sp. SL216 TaxID=2995169 RepID=UPI002376F0B8|nr:MFS transporter [Blastomonas sp. SL216]
MTGPGVSPASAPAARVTMGTKLAFGFGSVAYGIKDNGFAVFLLIYFNQVIGMPAEQVGLAVALALVADAFFDPFVGHRSDATRSRWGRRHPWLYGAALPIALSWLLLWNPPEWSNGALFFYLIAVAMAVRFSFSAYEVPALAMLPEMTRDYHERTEVLRYRFLFGWLGGLVMLYAAYALLLVPEPGYANGVLNPNGYHRYALVGSAVMIVSVVVSALGTHRLLARPNTDAPAAHSHGLKDFAAALRFRPFQLLLAAGVCAFANQGLFFALTNYLMLYVWEFEQSVFNIYPFVLFLGVAVAFFIVGPASRRLEKPRTASIAALLSLVFATLPYWLRLAGLFPPTGSGVTTILILSLIALSITFGICAMMMISSMIADVTDASEAETGKRTEGIFFAGFFFMQKCVGGLGILASALILAIAGFPDNAEPGKVAPDVIDRLAITFAIATTLIGLSCAWLFSRFPLGRADHEARLAQIARP